MSTAEKTEAGMRPMTEEELRDQVARDAAEAMEAEDIELTGWAEAMEMAQGIDREKLPTDEEYCDRFGYVLIQLDDEEERLKTQYERALKRIEQRRLHFRARHLQGVEAALSRLLDKAQGSRKTRPKSVDLARCRVGFRAQPVTVKEQSEDAVRVFAEKHSYAANTYGVEMVPKVRIDRKALKEAVDRYASEHGGALPDGIDLAGGGDKLYVSAPKSAAE